METPEQHWPLARVVQRFERLIVMTLMLLMMLVIGLSVLELGWLLFQDIVSTPIIILEVEELLDVFGFFLLILIGIELLETVKAYLRGSAARIEVVLEVALIAIARKVVALDLSKYSAVVVLGLAALIAALALAIAIVRRVSAGISMAPAA